MSIVDIRLRANCSATTDARLPAQVQSAVHGALCLDGLTDADTPDGKRFAVRVIRYATLASPTLRGAYDEAMGTIRRQLTLTPVGRPIVSDKVAWLATQMLKTRVAHGYCSRHEGQGACEYANICETCDNYTPATEFAAALTDQLADIQALQADADRRGWTSEAQRHERVAKALQGHLDRLP
jgi:hypothetical protein